MASGLKLTKRFNNDYVYKVQAATGLVPSWGKNINPVEYFENAKWRWMSNNGQLTINNYSRKLILANISIKVFSFFKPRALRANIGLKLIQQNQIGLKPTTFIIKKVLLKPGINKIIFKASPEAEVADSRIQNGDKRKLSISFGRLLVEEISR
jgi:hypothetical protein